MLSRGEKLFYVLSLFCIITGLMSIVTYCVYLSHGGVLRDGTVMKSSELITGIFAYLAFRIVPGFLGWKGFKKRDANFVKGAMLLTTIALILSVCAQQYIPGIGTGLIVPGVYIIICVRYLAALTKEQRDKDREFLQGPTDGPRLG
ncbi:MAG: hypothetical protein KBS66_04290 [Eubacterium sp.]|nr:hypothetical protein [Candidatus Colimonas fimequi]